MNDICLRSKFLTSFAALCSIFLHHETLFSVRFFSQIRDISLQIRNLFFQVKDIRRDSRSSLWSADHSDQCRKFLIERMKLKRFLFSIDRKFFFSHFSNTNIFKLFFIENHIKELNARLLRDKTHASKKSLSKKLAMKKLMNSSSKKVKMKLLNSVFRTKSCLSFNTLSRSKINLEWFAFYLRISAYRSRSFRSSLDQYLCERRTIKTSVIRWSIKELYSRSTQILESTRSGFKWEFYALSWMIKRRVFFRVTNS